MNATSPNHLLRHAAAALAYRAARACEDAPNDFGNTRCSEFTRTADEILAHMADLFDWATKLAVGIHEWEPMAPQPWELGVNRFFAALSAFDAALASEKPLACPAEMLLQGPIADALTHVGQLTMLRRAAGRPVIGESYFKAEIAIGQIAKTLPPPAAPFR